ncbi:MAG: hypothetical protein IPN94_23880 [Sphingobacteriales bacterium]|nr:hypothetical protein [Sphingobacteriales bacterium]
MPGSDITLTATGGTNYAWSGPNGYTAIGTPATISAVLLHKMAKYIP